MPATELTIDDGRTPEPDSGREDLALSLALATVVRLAARIERGSPSRRALARCAVILNETLADRR